MAYIDADFIQAVVQLKKKWCIPKKNSVENL
jgi:hypothetical protein